MRKLRLREVKWLVCGLPGNRQKLITAPGERELLCSPVHVAILKAALIGLLWSCDHQILVKERAGYYD